MSEEAMTTEVVHDNGCLVMAVFGLLGLVLLAIVSTLLGLAFGSWLAGVVS